MATGAWLNAGAVVMSGGNVVLCGSCPCTVTDCGECVAAPHTWRFTYAGISDSGFCGSCPSLNTTVNLAHDTACRWVSEIEFCSGWWGSGPAVWELKYIGSPTFVWSLHLWMDNTLGAAAVQYALARASWDCLGSNVMAIDGTTGYCAGWPATVTLAPA